MPREPPGSVPEEPAICADANRASGGERAKSVEWFEVAKEPEDGVLAMFDAMNIEPVYQPIFDLRDGSVVGYEALARGRGGNGLASPEELFAAARDHGRVAELDRACREAALAGAIEGGLGAPFCLFVNADARALEDDTKGSNQHGAGPFSWQPLSRYDRPSGRCSP